MGWRRWWVLVAAVVLLASVVCGVMDPELAVADIDENHTSAGQGTWPEKHQRSLDHAGGDELPEGTWRDGWCRRGERGYAVVIDYSHEPPERRGVLTAAHTREFGPTAADGWIVRCYEGPLKMVDEHDDWMDVVSLVGLHYMWTKNYVFPPGTEEPSSASMKTDPQILGLRWFAEGEMYGPIHQWNGGVWIRPDSDGGWSNGWPKSGTPRNGPWPSSTDNRLVPVSGDGQYSDVRPPAGSILYVAFGDFGASKDCKHPVEYLDAASPYICLGDAAVHPRKYQDPRTHQPCPGRTLTPQFSDGTVNGCVSRNPRPRPSAPTRGPGSGNGPHPHRPRHTRRPTPPARPHPGQHRAGVDGATGRDGTPHHGVFHRNAHKDVHAGGRVSSQVHGAARTPSPSASSSASPSVTPSPSTSPSVSAGVVVSPSPGDGRVWGSEQQGPSASDGARRRVPGWVWGTGAGVLVVAGVVAWWMTRGRRRDREDDEVGTDLFE